MGTKVHASHTFKKGESSRREALEEKGTEERVAMDDSDENGIGEDSSASHIIPPSTPEIIEDDASTEKGQRGKPEATEATEHGENNVSEEGAEGGNSDAEMADTRETEDVVLIDGNSLEEVLQMALQFGLGKDVGIEELLELRTRLVRICSRYAFHQNRMSLPSVCYRSHVHCFTVLTSAFSSLGTDVGSNRFVM